MWRLTGSILFAFAMISGNAQQDYQFTQYLYNQQVINPAVAGISGNSFTLMHRSQWIGMKGAPATQSFSWSMPVASQKIGLGAEAFNDMIGARRNTGVQFLFAYRPLNNIKKLSFGIRAGMFLPGVNKSAMNYYNPADPNALINIPVTPSFNIDAGVYYKDGRNFVGISASHLQGFSEATAGSHFTYKPHLFGYYAIVFKISQTVRFRPSVLVKYLQGADMNIDVNATLLFGDVFVAGLGYRTSNSVMLQLAVPLKNGLIIGYGFDYGFGLNTDLSRFGSHEIFIGFNLGGGPVSGGLLTPRYL